MRSRLQLDVRNLSLGKRHLANAYEVKAGIGIIAGNTVWSMPERLRFHDYALYKSTLPLPIVSLTSSSAIAETRDSPCCCQSLKIIRIYTVEQGVCKFRCNYVVCLVQFLRYSASNNGFLEIWVRVRSRSLKMALIDRSHTGSYLSVIVTVAPILYRFGDKAR